MVKSITTNNEVCTNNELQITFCQPIRINRVATNLGEKKFKDFSRTFKYVFKTYFSDVLLRCGHIKSNRINFVLLTIVTTQQVM